MRSSSFRLGLVIASSVALAACTALLGTFEVDPNLQDPDAGPGTSSGTSGSSGPGVDGSTTDGSSSGADANITCDGGETACGDTCADLNTSGDHCGACDRSCGGGVCAATVCQPVVVYDGAGGKIDGVATDGKDAFFSEATGLFACPVAGCKGARPRQLVNTTHYVATVGFLSGTVVFESAPAQATIRPALFACPPTGCAGLPASFSSAGLTGYDRHFIVQGGNITFNVQGQGVKFAGCAGGTCTTGAESTPRATSLFTASPTHRYYVATAAGSELSRCSATGVCVPEIVRRGDPSGISSASVEGDSLFISVTGRAGFNEGRIQRCIVPAVLPCTTFMSLAVAQSFPEQLFTSSLGTFWVNREDKRLQACKAGPCVGGARTITIGASVPAHLASDGTFLYWADGPKVFRVRP